MSFVVLFSSCQQEYTLKPKDGQYYFLSYQKNKEEGRQLFLHRDNEILKISLPKQEECAGMLKFDELGNCYFLTSINTGNSLLIAKENHKVSRWTGLVKVIPPSVNEPFSAYKMEYLLQPKDKVLYDFGEKYISSHKNISQKNFPWIVTNIKYVSKDGKYLILDILLPIELKGKEAMTSIQKEAIFFVKSKIMKIISENDGNGATKTGN